MRSILSRLNALEKAARPLHSVAIIVALLDGRWELNYEGTRNTYNSIERAQRKCPADTHFIVIDV